MITKEEAMDSPFALTPAERAQTRVDVLRLREHADKLRAILADVENASTFLSIFIEDKFCTNMGDVYQMLGRVNFLPTLLLNVIWDIKRMLKDGGQCFPSESEVDEW